MRCPCVVGRRPYGRRGKTQRFHLILPAPHDALNVERCEGQVHYEAKAEDEPAWGDHYAKLSERLVCSAEPVNAVHRRLFTTGHPAWRAWHKGLFSDNLQADINRLLDQIEIPEAPE